MTNNVSISVEHFEELLKKQDTSKRAMNWSDLGENLIYEIVQYEFIETKYGNACIFTLHDGNRVFAPSTLRDRFQKMDPENKNLPAFVRPKGKVKSEKTGNYFWDYDIVFS